MHTRPATLQKGDIVLLIATARKVSPAEMEGAIRLFDSWDLTVQCGQHLYASFNQFAGTDEQRLSDLQWALDHPSAKAIIVARGGYGTMRIIDRADFTRFRRNPKWFIGYSDVTVLHSKLLMEGFCSLHASMPINFGRNESATESLRLLLTGATLSYSLPPHPLNREGSADGLLAGGNLSILYANSSSATDMNCDGALLFIEDLDEYLYHIDRMMLQLKRAGKLSKLAGLIVGGMSAMRDNAIPFGKTAEQIIREAVDEYSYPVCFNFPAGHIDDNRAFIHGASARLVVSGATVTLRYT